MAMAVPVAGKDKCMARGSKGWFRRKKGALVFTWLNSAGKERSRVVGPDRMSDADGWIAVGALGLDKLVSKSDPANISFGELAEKFLAHYPFNKLSTRQLHEQIIRNLLVPRWGEAVAIEIAPPKLKAWMVSLDVAPPTRGKYKSVMSGVYSWAQCEGLISRGEQYNPCRYVKGREFSQVTGYEAMALDIVDVFAVLSELARPVYELCLLVIACQLRISEALGLKWRDVLWDRCLIAIRQTFVHLNVQEGAKTKLSRSRVELPRLVLDVLSAWRQETMYAKDDDYIFASEKLNGEQPRSGSMLVEDYIRPAAIRAGVITVKDGISYDRDGEVVKRFGFHILGRHSIATFLMDAQENPAVVQGLLRHQKMDMTLYYSHSRRTAKRAAQEKVLQHVLALQPGKRELTREPESIQR